MPKTLPRDLTSYDLLKTVAVILMVTDHVGYHFYPDEMWFRVLGRLCVPIWFFLIGYARSSEVPKSWWIGAGAVAASAIICGQYLLPLNILVTLILARAMRQGIVARTFHSPEGLRGMFFILFLSSFPTAVLFEYGTVGMLFMLMGYIIRHFGEVEKKVARRYLLLFSAASFFLFYVAQGMTLSYATPAQAMAMFLGFSAVFYALWNFKGETCPGLTRVLPRVAVGALQITGRYTLEIYVAHLVLFRAIAMNLEDERFGFLDWEIAPQGMIAAFM